MWAHGNSNITIMMIGNGDVVFFASHENGKSPQNDKIGKWKCCRMAITTLMILSWALNPWKTCVFVTLSFSTQTNQIQMRFPHTLHRHYGCRRRLGRLVFMNDCRLRFTREYKLHTPSWYVTETLACRALFDCTAFMVLPQHTLQILCFVRNALKINSTRVFLVNKVLFLAFIPVQSTLNLFHTFLPVNGSRKIRNTMKL